MKTLDTAQTVSQVLGLVNDVQRANAPEVLFLRGDESLLQLGVRVAVVGSRKASNDGLKRARKIARELAENGTTVVSGLALGVDTSAHRAAIDAGGRTIAVIGTSLDRFYPRENRTLQELIAREHLLVSQFPPDQAVQRFNFPIRNRLMALISNATIIVEAGDTSGSLSQGWESLRLGRPLFIMKSVVENPRLSWPAEMVKHGARVLAAPEDVLEVLPPAQVKLAEATF